MEYILNSLDGCILKNDLIAWTLSRGVEEHRLAQGTSHIKYRPHRSCAR
jgi:hypothetical protein